MKFAVFGSGAVGGYYGAKLAAAGHDVTFIARGAHLAAIRDRGLPQRFAGDRGQVFAPELGDEVEIDLGKMAAGAHVIDRDADGMLPARRILGPEALVQPAVRVTNDRMDPRAPIVRAHHGHGGSVTVEARHARSGGRVVQAGRVDLTGGEGKYLPRDVPSALRCRVAANQNHEKVHDFR